MNKKIICIGVGPGDPELLTLKAARLIRECDAAAVPGLDPATSVAYRIAAGAVPELAEKDLIGLPMPMSSDAQILKSAAEQAAKKLEELASEGKSVVYLTLGDPTVYCTFSRIQKFLEADGFSVEYVSGISSFCAAAARLGVPLAEWDETLHIIPGFHRAEEAAGLSGNCVIMKSAGRMAQIKELVKQSGRPAFAVSNCGMEGERVYVSAEDIPDDAGYFSVIILKEK